MDIIENASPRQLARIAGGLYLINIVLGAFAVGIVPAMLVVVGDAAATAHNIQSHELLYRLSVVANLVVGLTNVPLAMIFFELFKVTSRRLALLVVFSTLVATAIQISYSVNQFGTLALLTSDVYASAFTASQLQALAYLPVGLQPLSYDVSSVVFGFYAITIGYLIVESGFLPRAIGALMVIDGLAYLIYSFADFLAPTFAAQLVPWIQLPALLGEGSLCLWMLFVGVNSQRWTAYASAGAAS